MATVELPEYEDLPVRERRDRAGYRNLEAPEVLGEDETPTRTELLRVRGYDEETINGHHPPAPPESLEVQQNAGHACAGCGGPLDGPPSKRWCSTSCRKKAAYAKARTVAHNGATAAQVAPVASNGAGMNGSPSGRVAAGEARASRAEPTTTSNWLASGFQAVAYVLEAGELLPVYTRSR